MEKILRLRQVFDIALVVMVIGTLVFSVVFGTNLYLARQEALHEAEAKTEQAANAIQSYVDGELQRVEDVAYTLLSSKFAHTHRSEDGSEVFVSIDPARFQLPSEEEIFRLLEQFLDANPQLSGVAIGFENFVYPVNSGPYGTACYVTNVSGRKERLYLGKIHDYHDKLWYREAALLDHTYWSYPFEETSMHRIVSCFSVPLHGYANRLVGVLALDIDTENFRAKCHEIAPIAGATVTIDELQPFAADAQTMTSDDALTIKRTIARNGWTVTVSYPLDAIMGGVKRMQRRMAYIGSFGLLLMIICFLVLFRRMQKVTLEKAGIESELHIASAIQMSMIPKTYPAYPERKELDVFGFLLPAKSVGGDLFDYVIHEDKFYFCVGDVSGKGIPASLFMAVVRALFRNVSSETVDPAHLVQRVNDIVAEGNDMNMFCTFFVGILDLKTGHLAYCNAGHNAPVIRRKQESGVDVHFTTPHTNLALGIVAGFPYQAEELTLMPGEAIFLYTDGVTEAENKRHELFGEQGLMDALQAIRRRSSLTPKDFVMGVHDKVKKHAGNAEQSDDITMLVVEYKGCNFAANF